MFKPVRSLCLAAALAAPGAVVAACPGPDGITSTQMTGTWSVGTGEAFVNSAPMLGGSNELVLQGSGGGLTLTVEGQRVRLDRVTAVEGWDTDIGAVISSNDVAIVLGCELGAMSAWRGIMVVDGETVTWQVIAVSTTNAVVQWSFVGGVVAQGVFQITK
jgi:hypothetical protein